MKDSRHFFTWILGLVFIFQISQTYAGTDVPVLIWSGNLPISNSHLVNPFEKTSQRGFEKILTKIVGGSLNPILVFVKDDLCVEDLIKHKESLKSLMNMGSLIYRPAVDDPVSVFESLPLYNCTTEDEPDSLSEAQLVLKNVTDLDGVSKIYKIMKKSSSNLIAALTGRSCRYSRSNRIKRAAGEEPPTPAPAEPFFVNASRILMYAGSDPSLLVSENQNISVELIKTTPGGEGTVDSPLQLNFEYTVKNDTPYNVNILMQFPVKSAGYYKPEVLYKRGDENSTLLTKLDLSFPFNFSYHCSNKVKFGNPSLVRFELEDFQVQIDAKNFGDAYDCVGFMSIPIWSGIFVTAILAIIMTWGLTMIMDIRTMDRFDDPKGKTITISASTE